MKKVVLILVGLLLSFTASANAIPSLVQFDPSGNATYSIQGIFEFDWSSSGNLVIEQNLVTASNGATTLGQFINIASNGDTLKMNIHAHSRLTAFLDDNGDTITAADLSTDGGATGFWEVTGTLDGVETAEYREIGGQDWLFFTDITGEFNYYLDTSPDSVVTTGTGFNNGDTPGASTLNPFLTGTLELIEGSFNGSTGTGSSFLTNTITDYDSNIIEVDPVSSSVYLTGTTFDSTIKFLGTQTGVEIGGVIGDAPYTVQANDLILNADANSEFSAVPEPATIALFGIGLLGFAGVARRKK